MTDRVTYRLPAGPLGRAGRPPRGPPPARRGVRGAPPAHAGVLEERARSGPRRVSGAARPPSSGSGATCGSPTIRGCGPRPTPGRWSASSCSTRRSSARRHHAAPARLRFLRAGLEALDAELRLPRRAAGGARGRARARVVPGVAAEAGAARGDLACARSRPSAARATPAWPTALRHGRGRGARDRRAIWWPSRRTCRAPRAPGTSSSRPSAACGASTPSRRTSPPPRRSRGRICRARASRACPRGDPPLTAGPRPPGGAWSRSSATAAPTRTPSDAT